MSAIVDEGVSLLAVVEAGSSGKRLDELSVARVIADAAEALDGASPRTQPIVPAGVIILLNGSVKLETKLVPLREAIGYTAPEKLKGQTDHRNDVFSLGVVMWEALTHARLFSGATEAEMKTCVLESELHAPSEHNANVPSELDAICMKALARDPDQRYATAKAMAVEIEGVLRDAGYGRTNEPIAAYVVKLPKEARKRTKTAPPKYDTIPDAPKLTSAVNAGLAAAPVEAAKEPAKEPPPPLVPSPPKLPPATIVEDTKSTIVGISSMAREPAKPVANTVTGVPSLASALPEAKPGTPTVMGVPSLASVLPEPKPAAPVKNGASETLMGVSPAGSMPAMKAEEPILLVPQPPKLPSVVNGPHQVPPAVAAAVTQAVPATPAKPADDFVEETPSPDPAEAVALPRAKSETGPNDPLSKWAWSTDTHTALVDDEPLDEIAPPSKRPLFIAIGAAAAVLGVIVIIAFAAGGSKDDKNKDQQASAQPVDEHAATTPPPAEPPKQETPPPVEPPAIAPPAEPAAEAPKQDTPPPAEPPKVEAAAAQPEPPKPEPPKVEPPKAEPPPAVVAKVEPPKVEPKKPEPPKAVAKVEPPKVDVKKPEPPKTVAKVEPKAKPAAKKPPPPRVATKAKQPVDPYPDTPAKPKGDAESAYRTGLQQFARGDTNGALVSLKSALNENPRFPPTWRGLGLVYEKLGDRNQAARAYRRYLELAPKAGDAEQIRGRLERLGS